MKAKCYSDLSIATGDYPKSEFNVKPVCACMTMVLSIVYIYLSTIVYRSGSVQLYTFVCV